MVFSRVNIAAKIPVQIVNVGGDPNQLQNSGSWGSIYAWKPSHRRSKSWTVSGRKKSLIPWGSQEATCAEEDLKEMQVVVIGFWANVS